MDQTKQSNLSLSYENPRYQKVIETAVHHFLQKNLDEVFIATNAPGRSAFNHVERCMVSLGKELQR